MNKALISLILIALVGCGTKKKSDAPEQANIETNNEKACRENGGTIQDGQCNYPGTNENAKQLCAEKGADFEWVDAKCVQVPNIKLEGELSSEPGLLWEANTETCDKVDTVDGIRYTNCAGIDAFFYLNTITSGKSKIELKIDFYCEAITNQSVKVEITNMDNGIGSSDGIARMDQAFHSGDSPLSLEVLALQDQKPKVSLQLAAGDILTAVKEGCRIALVENTATSRN